MPIMLQVTALNSGGWMIPFAIVGPSTYGQVSTGSGGWQIVDRPRQSAITQWYDRAPWTLTLQLMLDGQTISGNADYSIEPFCATLESWLDKVPGTSIPPVLQLNGPVPGTQRQWVMYTCDFSDDSVIRDPLAGYRIQQKVGLTLYEYNPSYGAPTFTLTPAAQAQQALTASTANPSYVTYTVVAGDTLATIAANLLGNYNLWQEIAAANNIRDPNSITAGQTLIIPQSTGSLTS